MASLTSCHKTGSRGQVGGDWGQKCVGGEGRGVNPSPSSLQPAPCHDAHKRRVHNILLCGGSLAHFYCAVTKCPPSPFRCLLVRFPGRVQHPRYNAGHHQQHHRHGTTGAVWSGVECNEECALASRPLHPSTLTPTALPICSRQPTCSRATCPPPSHHKHPHHYPPPLPSLMQVQQATDMDLGHSTASTKAHSQA